MYWCVDRRSPWLANRAPSQCQTPWSTRCVQASPLSPPLAPTNGSQRPTSVSKRVYGLDGQLFCKRQNAILLAAPTQSRTTNGSGFYDHHGQSVAAARSEPESPSTGSGFVDSESANSSCVVTHYRNDTDEDVFGEDEYIALVLFSQSSFKPSSLTRDDDRVRGFVHCGW